MSYFFFRTEIQTHSLKGEKKGLCSHSYDSLAAGFLHSEDKIIIKIRCWGGKKEKALNPEGNTFQFMNW